MTRSTRRKFIKTISILLFSATGVAQLSRCKKDGGNKASTDPCQDLSSLTDTERATRQQLGYVPQSSFGDRTCSNCNLFVKSDESLACGSCLVMKGPVADKGYCTVWVPVDLG